MQCTTMFVGTFYSEVWCEQRCYLHECRWISRSLCRFSWFCEPQGLVKEKRVFKLSQPIWCAGQYMILSAHVYHLWESFSKTRSPVFLHSQKLCGILLELSCFEHVDICKNKIIFIKNCITLNCIQNELPQMLCPHPTTRGQYYLYSNCFLQLYLFTTMHVSFLLFVFVLTAFDGYQCIDNHFWTQKVDFWD